MKSLKERKQDAKTKETIETLTALSEGKNHIVDGKRSIGSYSIGLLLGVMAFFVLIGVQYFLHITSTLFAMFVVIFIFVWVVVEMLLLTGKLANRK